MSSSTSFSKNLCLSSTLKMEEEAMVTKKQGIVTILASDISETKAASLKRTLSADMSSKKWLIQNGFTPLKRIASSKQVSHINDDEEDEPEEEDGKTEDEEEKPCQFDIWSSIISQKSKDENKKNGMDSNPTPYVHPLMKKSSSLSKKSLEICTESLGSETGSDEFVSYPASEPGDVKGNKDEQQNENISSVEAVVKDKEDEVVVSNKYNYDVGKKLPQRVFPPPIHSLSCQDGAALQMRSHRDNGRLVLEAVTGPPQCTFLAQRQGGRLVLTISNNKSYENEKSFENEVELEDIEEEFEDMEEEFEGIGDVYDETEDDEDEETEDDEDEDEETEELETGEGNENGEKREMGVFSKQKFLSGVIYHRLAKVTMSKSIGVPNRNPMVWSSKFSEIVKGVENEDEDEDEDEDESAIMVVKSLPPRSQLGRALPPRPSVMTTTLPTTTVGSLNAYEYYWRRPTMGMAKEGMAKEGVKLNPIVQQLTPLKLNNSSNKLILSKNPIPNQQQMVGFKGNNNGGGDDKTPIFNGCKESKRSLIFWESQCIATS